MFLTKYKLKNFFSENEESFFLLTFFISILFFFLVKNLLFKDYLHISYKIIVLSLLLFFFLKNKKENLNFSILINLYGLGALIGFYILFSEPYISKGFQTEFSKINYEDYLIIKYSNYFLYAIIPLCFWKPLCSFFIFFLLFLKKKSLENYYNFFLSPTDWMVVAEYSSFLILTLTIFDILSNYVFKIDNKKININKIQFYILISCICIHFSNYFYSGIAKLGFFHQLENASLFTWILKNDTSNLILSSLQSGSFPFTSFENLSKSIYKFCNSYTVPLNIAVVITQTACLFCILKKWSIKIICIIYDIQHLAIFLISGIFFWKWIFLNFIIFFSIDGFKRFEIHSKIKIFFVIIILAAPLTFFVTKLAWFDTKSLNLAFFQAVDDQGQVYNVPSNYFGSISLPVAQMRLGRNFQGFFETGTYANTYDYSKYKDLNSCGNEILVNNNHQAITQKNITNIKHLVKTNHEFVLEVLNNKDKINYDLYPHHIWSNLFVYQKFKDLDKAKIKKYIYVLQAGCLKYDFNKDKTLFTIKKEKKYVINIKK